MNDILQENENWIRDFEKCFKKDEKESVTFADIFNRMIEERHITETEFQNKTHIDRNTFRYWKNGTKRPSMRKFVVFCITYKINFARAVYMMGFLEITFILTNRVHYAYYNLIEHCSGKTLLECNKILNELNIDEVHWLGNDDDKWWEED